MSRIIGYQLIYPMWIISRSIMRAVIYHGLRNIQVDDKPRPTIQGSEDVILRVTSTALCVLRGAARVFSIDHWPNRLHRTKDLGAEIINFDHEDPVEKIRKESKGKGVICIDAVGYEAVGHTHNNKGEDGISGSNSGSGDNTTATVMHDHSKISDPTYEPANPLQVTNWMSQVARKFSTISIPGVYVSAYDQFSFGQLFNCELQIRMGQCPVKKYNEQLLHLIETGRIDATKIISHTMKLNDAPKAYEMFDKKEDVTKIIFKVQKG